MYNTCQIEGVPCISNTQSNNYILVFKNANETINNPNTYEYKVTRINVKWLFYSERSRFFSIGCKPVYSQMSIGTQSKRLRLLAEVRSMSVSSSWWCTPLRPKGCSFPRRKRCCIGPIHKVRHCLQRPARSVIPRLSLGLPAWCSWRSPPSCYRRRPCFHSAVFNKSSTIKQIWIPILSIACITRKRT